MNDPLPSRNAHRPSLLSSLVDELKERLRMLSGVYAAEQSLSESVEAMVEYHDALDGVLEYVIDLGGYRELFTDPAVDLDEILDWCIAVKVDLDRAFVANLPLTIVAPA